MTSIVNFELKTDFTLGFCHAEVSRYFRGGAARINVFEGDRLNLSDDTASSCKVFRTGESDRPLNRII